MLAALNIITFQKLLSNLLLIMAGIHYGHNWSTSNINARSQTWWFMYEI